MLTEKSEPIIEFSYNNYCYEWAGSETLGIPPVYIELYWPDGAAHPKGWVVHCNDEGETFSSEVIKDSEEAVNRATNYIWDRLAIYRDEIIRLYKKE